MSVNQSIRMDRELRDRIEREAEATGTTRNALMQRYLDEGLRMDRHPGIVFRPGPSGRRPAVAGGPDVWEVVRAVNDATSRGDAAITEAATYLGLTQAQVRTAVRYYADHRAEIDAWTEAVDRLAAEAEEAWLRERDVLR
jgi:hypothetical protein